MLTTIVDGKSRGSASDILAFGEQLDYLEMDRGVDSESLLSSVMLSLRTLQCTPYGAPVPCSRFHRSISLRICRSFKDALVRDEDELCSLFIFISTGSMLTSQAIL